MKKSPSKFDSDIAFQSEVKQIYGYKCAICHGKTGKSVIKTATDLRTSTMSLEEKKAIIKYGKNTMPPQSEVLNAEMIEGLAHYITTFKK